jgi:hypothetical protein
MLCPICASDEDTSTHQRDDGVTYAVCLGPSHGPEGFVWEPTPPPAPKDPPSPGSRVRFFIDPTKSDAEIAEALAQIVRDAEAGKYAPPE